MFNDSNKRLGKTKALVQFVTANNKPLIGEVFLTQGERVIDLLNDERRFIPIELHDGTVRVIAKDNILDAMLVDEAPKEKSNPYKILRVQKGASFAEVRDAWKNRMKACHPDRLASLDLDEDLVYQSRRITQKINEAYETIISEVRQDKRDAAKQEQFKKEHVSANEGLVS